MFLTNLESSEFNYWISISGLISVLSVEFWTYHMLHMLHMLFLEKLKNQKALCDLGLFRYHSQAVSIWYRNRMEQWKDLFRNWNSRFWVLDSRSCYLRSWNSKFQFPCHWKFFQSSKINQKLTSRHKSNHQWPWLHLLVILTCSSQCPIFTPNVIFEFIDATQISGATNHICCFRCRCSRVIVKLTLSKA